MSTLLLPMVFLFLQQPEAGTPVTKDEPGLPRVLIIGDSISMGYTPFVAESLKGKANVLRIPGNGSSTSFGLANLDKWIGSGSWQVIHFNFGLHDAKLPPEGTRHAPPDVYEKNLLTIVEKLKKTNATLIFATTTPVPNGGNLAPNRKFGDVNTYNTIAVQVMKNHGVHVNDLNKAITPSIEKSQIPKDVHFTKEGSKLLAEAVAKTIEQSLPKPSK